MRIVLICVMVVLASTALAAGWSSYDNVRFGYSIAIPPGFAGRGEADNGDGQAFANASGTQVLAVWGGNVVEDDFEAEVAQDMTFAEDEGWNITYRASTPTWASYSGIDGDRVIYVRSIALCGGEQYASFQLEYFVADLAALDPVVNRLVRSFSATGQGSC